MAKLDKMQKSKGGRGYGEGAIRDHVIRSDNVTHEIGIEDNLGDNMIVEMNEIRLKG